MSTRSSELVTLAERLRHLGMLWRAFLWWVELWRREHDVAGLQRVADDRRLQLERSWSRWEQLKAGRKKESVRRELAAIERSLDERAQSLTELIEFIERKRREAWTVVRWIWQGHVDNRDGPLEQILTVPQRKRHR